MTTTLTVKKGLPDRSLYLPHEARLLRQRIASLDEQSVVLYHEAEAEFDLLHRACDLHNGWWFMAETVETINGICGYASYAALRVPQQYPPDALERLRALSVFNLPVVAEWYERCGSDAPKAQLYLEMMEHLRLLTMEFVERFNTLIVDQKAF